MTDWDPEAFTKALIADLREHAGQVTSGPMAGQTLLILTTTGTKTGQPRVAVVTATRDGDAYVVAGSKGGAPTDPVLVQQPAGQPVETQDARLSVYSAGSSTNTGICRSVLAW